MRILAVDTSGKEIGIGVFEGKKCLYEKYMTAERAYNRHIMPMIGRALAKARLTLDKIDVFAAALGPGSFTGIRVGMAVMKAFAHGKNKAFAGVSTLDIIAAAAGAKGRVWAVLEAGRGEVYAAKYGRKPSKQKYMLLSREAFFGKLKAGDTVTGIKGENILVELAEKNSKINVLEQGQVSLKSFAEIIGRGNKGRSDGLYKTAPVYIRPSEAEARLRLKSKTKAV